MRQQLVSLAAFLGCLGVMSGQTQAQQQERIPCESLPAAVRATFEKALPNATMQACLWEKDGQQVTYEISSRFEGGVTRDAVLSSEGKLIAVEELITNPGDIPGSVLKAVKQRYPTAAIMSTKKVTRDTKTFYEFGVQRAGKIDDVVFDAAGKEVELD